MNIVFYFLVILAAVVLWFLLAFLFPAVGNLLCRMLEDVKRGLEISEKDKK